MALLKHLLLSFTMIIISFVACYSTLQEDPPSSIIYIDHSPSIDDGRTFKNLIKQSTNVLSLNRFDKRSSLKKLSVNDYGAKGNGDADDTEVHIHLVQNKVFFFLFSLATNVNLVHVCKNVPFMPKKV